MVLFHIQNNVLFYNYLWPFNLRLKETTFQEVVRFCILAIRQLWRNKLLYLVMSNRNIVITGANTGIGLQTARGLFADGNNIIFGSRNEQKNIAAIQSITKSLPNSSGAIKSFKLDLSSRSSVQSFADAVKKEFNHVDILINNAGLMMNDRQVNEDGVEMTMAVNHFGHFLSTYLLFPLIRQSKQARIINVSSDAHKYFSADTSLDIASQQGFGSFSNYAKSKLANVQFTVGLGEKLTKYPNIKVMSLHPGVIDSEFGTGITGVGFFKILCCCFYSNNQTGARTSLFLSRSNFANLRSGQFYDRNTELGRMNESGRNRQHINNLWKAGQKLFKIQFII